MNRKLFEKIITEKRAKCSNERPKYGLRKLTVGVVSCLLGYMMFMTPNVVVAEKADAPQAVEATVESTEGENVEVKEKTEQPSKEVVKPTETKATDLARTSSVAKKSAVQPRSAVATETSKKDAKGTGESTEFKLTDEQKKQLVDAGLTKEEIKFVTNEINSELAKDKNFKVDEYLKKVIELKKAGKEIGIEAISRNDELSINNEPGAETNQVGAPNDKDVDALSSATYYNKANWENKIKDKSRWKVGDNQTLVRVTTSEPVEMNDIDYDGNFVDANGRTVLRMVYKEKAAAVTTVWYRAIFNFGDLDQYIDYDKSYIVGVDTFANESKRGTLDPFNDRKERIVDLGVLRGDATNQRKNLPINLVLKEGYTIKDLVQKNYIVQMRLADKNGKKIYAYAPKGSSMDYSSYTKTTSVSLEDKVNRLFIKGGYQSDNTSATNQEFVMSEFIANPDQYKDEKNLGIIRTQYMGQRSGNAASPTVGGKPIAFTQAFDAKLLDYLKEDDKGNVAYVNVLEDTRQKSKYSHNFGIKKTDFNLSKDGKLAYLYCSS